MLDAAGIPAFNPDMAARQAIAAARGEGRELTQAEANAWAWNEGVRLLRQAIAERRNAALETTLGGDTIAGLLTGAARAGIGVSMWFVGLESVALHVARVKLRVSQGGHDIPLSDIERRYVNSRVNLIRLLPMLGELAVYDNSGDASAESTVPYEPKLVLRASKGVIAGPADLSATPAWAKPIVAAAMKLHAARRSRR